MKAILKITEATGKSWDLELTPGTTYTIGRAQGNDIVLNDRRVSRQHAQVVAENGNFKLVDGYYVGGEIQRSVNRVFVNGLPYLEKPLETGDLITIGASRLAFENIKEEIPKKMSPVISESSEITMTHYSGTGVNYDDNPLGHTQLLMSASEIMGRQTGFTDEDKPATPGELKVLRRKAQILEMLYEMSKTLGTVFDLKEIFIQATDLIFRGTPADRVVALLADETLDGKILDYSLYPIALKTRDKKMEAMTEELTISRTITQKVMREKIALLSQDAKTDSLFSGAVSIVSQGVRSTICAPLITESNVHGVVYADRLDPFSSFSEDDLDRRNSRNCQSA